MTIESYDPFSPDFMEQAYPGYKRAMAIRRAVDDARHALNALDDVFGGTLVDLCTMINESPLFKQYIQSWPTYPDWRVEQIEVTGFDDEISRLLVRVDWSAVTKQQHDALDVGEAKLKGVALVDMRWSGKIEVLAVQHKWTDN